MNPRGDLMVSVSVKWAIDSLADPCSLKGGSAGIGLWICVYFSKSQEYGRSAFHWFWQSSIGALSAICFQYNILLQGTGNWFPNITVGPGIDLMAAVFLIKATMEVKVGGGGCLVLEYTRLITLIGKPTHQHLLWYWFQWCRCTVTFQGGRSKLDPQCLTQRPGEKDTTSTVIPLPPC